MSGKSASPPAVVSFKPSLEGPKALPVERRAEILLNRGEAEASLAGKRAKVSPAEGRAEASLAGRRAEASSAEGRVEAPPARRIAEASPAGRRAEAPPAGERAKAPPTERRPEILLVRREEVLAGKALPAKEIGARNIFKAS